ncbi:MAG: UDP-N-acetylglucosamine--N-acetylmuramyl-(pentapeptide) pyrophosphoryl-undecaprenol N-acetylglucosamine transferase [Candidatus Yanofskybacteria bacterium CG10_big_fil_rev_8_21_14_0_10_37_15]|uniref:UDP-N-acetylglucosamine--N-acetylmuramyl-(pentapeptide) pyrophosphoryl-undecaprenol N-acetylglucosamine transferase n=1 Tax=Candidatus Yanofskybacteria bacterium CG10_big_fil_rev_8_21_14_0_10_37_15 TaxID=1975097 RepID=A0A2H0R7U0_9BACT|nr:MAG: UDP-N-acetylglucosamine--N-acetylmuramyl-(pentapeptide) pyrophosphoryl-undecaprenol N-acetylglucosamine transferase [Candidatus Yanofskybacteria bacterium CG10_big_fil_rev_8_21_14_0_10_37_15]
MANYRVLLLGGGSGGHVFPLIAVADSLKEKASQKGILLELMAMGEGSFLKNVCLERGLVFKPILSGKIRRYFSIHNFFDFFKTFFGLIQSFWHIFWFMPDVIFSKGGYASFPGTLIGWFFFIPVYIHESDSVPGLSNKISGLLAKKVFISFKSTERYFKAGKSFLTGNPVRKDLFIVDKETSIQMFGLDQNKKTILIIGGSQGAQKVNEAVLNSLVMMVSKFQIIHQCGQGQYDAVKVEVERLIKEGEGHYAENIKNNYKFFPFLNSKQYAGALAVCDVVISRAGAGSISEISFSGKPAILIPISNSGGNHQLENALEFSKYGGVYIEEENLNPNILLNQIESLLEPEKYQTISEKIKTFAHPDASDKIAEALLGQV